MLTMRCFQLLLIAAALLSVAGRSRTFTLTPARRAWGSPLLQRYTSNPILAFIRGGSDDKVQQEDSANEEEDEEEEEESWGEDGGPLMHEGEEEGEEEVEAEEQQQQEEEEANIEVQPFMEETPSSEESPTAQTEEWVNNSNDNDEDEKAEAIQQQQEASSFPADVVVDDPSVDDDSSAFVDRMELADAYDEGETTSGETEADAASRAMSVPVIAEADDKKEAEEVIVSEEPEGDAARNSSTLKVNTQQLPVINKETIKVLVKELNYRRREVNAMKHDVVAMVAAKRLHRPMEGIPSHWFRNDDSSKPFTAAKNFMARFVIPIAAGSLVLWVAMSQQDSGCEFTELVSKPSISSVAEPVVTVPAYYDAAESTASTSATAFGTQEDEEGTAASPLVTPEESLKPVNEHVGSLGDAHPHSVKPGQAPQDELDVTWLDKGITAVENMIKSFLRMEL